MAAMTDMNWRTYGGVAVAAMLVLAPPAVTAQRSTALAHRIGGEGASSVDLTHTTIVTRSTPSVTERTAVRVLVEEREKRTGVRLPVASQWPAETEPVVAMGPLAPAPAVFRAPEHYSARSRVAGSAPAARRAGSHVAISPMTTIVATGIANA